MRDILTWAIDSRVKLYLMCGNLACIYWPLSGKNNIKNVIDA